MGHYLGICTIDYNDIFIITGPLASILCDKYGCKQVVMLGGFLLSLGVTTSGLSSSVYHMYMTYGILGGTVNMFYVILFK